MLNAHLKLLSTHHFNSLQRLSRFVTTAKLVPQSWSREVGPAKLVLWSWSREVAPPDDSTGWFHWTSPSTRHWTFPGEVAPDHSCSSSSHGKSIEVQACKEIYSINSKSQLQTSFIFERLILSHGSSLLTAIKWWQNKVPISPPTRTKKPKLQT